MWTICDGRSCLVFSVQQDLCQDRKIMSQQISAQLFLEYALGWFKVQSLLRLRIQGKNNNQATH